MEVYEVKRQLHSPAYSKPASRSPSPALSPPAAAGDSYRALTPSPPPRHGSAPPPSPPVPTQPRMPTAPEPPGPLRLLPCAVCSRTFLPESLPKHTKICEKAAAKKRKTFDSSRQRREGTDLEQYLPKNFGLPENSPFIEKSPPHTAKVAPKKTASVRSVASKPAADLSKCPHCSRAFGARAFERHVDWCAEKAKILPAAPSNPPPHVAEAKNRLNARTQYKAPLVRNRRSLTRDKASNSRSTSVESMGVRGLSPPPPRESGDYRRSRTRVSESLSPSECNEDSAHVPVIRNSNRGSLNTSTSGEAVRARQARLARDLGNNNQHPQTNVQQSKTDPCISKIQCFAPNKCAKISVKKQQQLRKLEEIAKKYNDTVEKKKAENVEKSNRNARDRSALRTSQIPKKSSKPSLKSESNTQLTARSSKTGNNVSGKLATDSAINITYCSGIASNKNIKEIVGKAEVNKEIKDSEKRNKISKKPANKSLLRRENSVSQDSLDEPQDNSGFHSIGINTEKLQGFSCVPCVIHQNMDQKKTTCQKPKEDFKDCKSQFAEKHVKMEILQMHLEPKQELELLYKNPSMVSSCEVQGDYYVYEDEIDHQDFKNYVSISNLELPSSDNSDKLDKPVNDQIISESKINSESYTKITHRCDSDDFEEFMNMTDKMMIDSEPGEVSVHIDDFISGIHTPNTESLVNLNKDHFLEGDSFAPNANVSRLNSEIEYSDSISELKNQLKDILIGPDEQDDEDEANRVVSSMEHITIYELNTSLDADDSQTFINEQSTNKSKETLPSICENNKINKKTMNNNLDKISKKKVQKSCKKYKMLKDSKRSNKEFKTFIVADNVYESLSDVQSVTSEAPTLKLPRIDNPRMDFDDNYDPFLSAARQMKELMSSDTNIPKKVQSTPKDPCKTLPYLRNNNKEKSPPFRPDTSKVMKDTINKNTQQTPTLQRMKSFGSTNSDYSCVNTFGGRSSSFRVNRNDNKKSSPKLNKTFTKSSKENISTVDKFAFNRTNSLNKSFSSYTGSYNYNTSRTKDKPMSTSMTSSLYHSFQRTIKPPSKLEKIVKTPVKKEFVNLDSILTDDNSSTTDSNYIDPRLINENDNLPINVSTILNNPDIISSMESLLNTDNLPAKFESFKVQDNKYDNNNYKEQHNDYPTIDNKPKTKGTITPRIDDLSAQYDKIMTSLEQSITSKISIRDDDSLCEDFDLEEFMTSFDEELNKQKIINNKRSYSSTTRIVKAADKFDSNRTSEFNSISSSPKVINNGNGMIPYNKSNSMTFSNNNKTESMFPSSVKRSASLIDSFQKKNSKEESQKNKQRERVQKVEEIGVDQDIMESFKEFEKFYENEKVDSWSTNKEVNTYNCRESEKDTVKRQSRVKSDKNKLTDDVQNHNHQNANGKVSNDSAYSSLNRISPSKLSICNNKDLNTSMSSSMDHDTVGSEFGANHKEIGLRAISSDEFLALERSTEELDRMPIARQNSNISNIDKDVELYKDEKRALSHTSSGHRTPSCQSSWRSRNELSSSSSESSLPVQRNERPKSTTPTAQRLSRFCHECGNKFPVDTAKFCIECGAKRLVI